MNIKKAIEHFEWKFTNHWKPSKTDIEAYNEIVDFVEKKNKQQFNDNQLFGKLFISFYGELLRYYKATVFDKEPQKAISKILNSSTEDLIKKFIDKATNVEQSLEFTFNGELKHPQQLNKQQKESIKIIEPVMNYNEAKDNLTAMINNALNTFN